MVMLEVRNLHKRYSGIPAVDSVSFIARAGEVTGYLGANGSGKSTTMKMATGLIEPNAGEILFEGRRIKENLMAYRQRMGYVPEEPHILGLFPGLDYLIYSPKCLISERLPCSPQLLATARRCAPSRPTWCSSTAPS